MPAARAVPAFADGGGEDTAGGSSIHVFGVGIYREPHGCPAQGAELEAALKRALADNSGLIVFAQQNCYFAVPEPAVPHNNDILPHENTRAFPPDGIQPA